jgi:hypothetical protein
MVGGAPFLGVSSLNSAGRVLVLPGRFSEDRPWFAPKREPDFCIGGWEQPYIRRWWLIPRNRWFNVYLHQILRSDDDRALHDHPWLNCSILLRGWYREKLPGDRMKIRRAGRSIVFRRAVSAHRLEVEAPCWSLFITGPIIRSWGFHCPKGWVHWRDFTSPDDTGQIGRGCGEMGNPDAPELGKGRW